MLSLLHVQVREIVGRACEDTLAQAGFVPDPIEDPNEEMEGKSRDEGKSSPNEEMEGKSRDESKSSPNEEMEGEGT